VPVTVGVDQAALQADLANLLPGTKLDVRLSNNVVIVSGTLSHAAEAESLHRFLDISSLKYVDMTTLPGLRQVQLKVKVAEASRLAIRALAINTGFVDTRGSFGASNVALNQFGLVQRGGGSFFGDKDPVSAVTLFGRAFIGSTTVESFIAALADNQYMRVLAEPTLVATSGQEASFLAGGEFPIPVVQGGTGLAANNSITIEYKEFGVRLHFRPTVLGDGKIHLHVAPEVSQLSGDGPGAVKLQGFEIPAILTRRAETTFELENGQTFAMAGLINQETQARSQRVPMLGDLPIIGALFRSVRYQQGDTELVIMVTASLVKPESMAADMPFPGMEHVAPNDWELYAVGRLASKDSSNKISNSDAKWLKEVGLNKLHGPGAWTTYDTPPAEPQPDMQQR
jgi:pilus assembly protein CpaC